MIQIPEAQTQFPCEKCNYIATSKSNLKRHKQSFHEGFKYSCDNCDYTATMKVHLIQHMRTIHIETKNPSDSSQIEQTFIKQTLAITKLCLISTIQIFSYFNFM